MLLPRCVVHATPLPLPMKSAPMEPPPISDAFEPFSGRAGTLGQQLQLFTRRTVGVSSGQQPGSCADPHAHDARSSGAARTEEGKGTPGRHERSHRKGEVRGAAHMRFFLVGAT